eukprot:1161480-Pelagomonas_calceolata.AAC.23
MLQGRTQPTPVPLPKPVSAAAAAAASRQLHRARAIYKTLSIDATPACLCLCLHDTVGMREKEHCSPHNPQSQADIRSFHCAAFLAVVCIQAGSRAAEVSRGVRLCMQEALSVQASMVQPQSGA